MALNILAVTAEAFPLAKTGGLGDAVSGLALAVNAIGPNVTLMLPAYRETMPHIRNVHKVVDLSGLPGGAATLLECDCPELGLPVLLLKNDALYDREGLYVDANSNEYTDNAIRFAALTRAAAIVASGLPDVVRPDIVHAHDWHAALTPLYMRQLRVSDVKTVLTLHNVAFQGVFPMHMATALGIEVQYCVSDAVEFWGQLNFLKAGIRYADLITVVSENYAREILTPQFGCGLQDALKQRGSDLISIANGIDTRLWNPQKDEYLPRRSFNAHNLHNKLICKRQLQQQFGLTQNDDATVMAMGSRLTTQKMADVAAVAIPMVLDTYPELQVCVIGHGDKALEHVLCEVGHRYPHRCGVHIGFDEAQAHLLHAGADILLHPSRFEPFGLTPLYSMRYGTIPVGSRVGGMADTIVDPGKGSGHESMKTATGILFQGESALDMVLAIERAMTLRGKPEIWQAMQQNAMKADFGWAKTAPAYRCAYETLRPDVEVGQIPKRGSIRAASHRTLISPHSVKVSSS